VAKYDVVVIGAGAVGCAIARELSRYNVSCAVLEKANDVAMGTSGKNSAVVHAGFNNKVGSLMARFCVEGNLGFEELAKELDIPYKKKGKLVVAFDEEDMTVLKNLVEQGNKNGCVGLELIGQDKLHQLEPNVGGIGAMWSKNTAVINPFLYTVALAEHAHRNGVEFFFNFEVSGIRKREDGTFEITDGENVVEAGRIINSAGLYSDKVAAMAGDNRYKIYPCRGEYYILDKRVSDFISMPVYPAPKKGIGGLGVHLTTTEDNNVLIGPSAEYIDSRLDVSTTEGIGKKLFDEAVQLLPPLKRSHIIASYAGLRAKQTPPEVGGFADFEITESTLVPGLLNLIGIESPGLTASVPIARYVVTLLKDLMPLSEKETFLPAEKRPKRFRDLTEEEREQLCRENPEYGEIVCRCEHVSKAEIRAAIENPLGVRSLIGIKYRSRSMMGRCQGGYCMTKIVEMLTTEYGMKPEEIEFNSRDSHPFIGGVKE